MREVAKLPLVMRKKLLSPEAAGTRSGGGHTGVSQKSADETVDHGREDGSIGPWYWRPDAQRERTLTRYESVVHTMVQSPGSHFFGLIITR